MRKILLRSRLAIAVIYRDPPSYSQAPEEGPAEFVMCTTMANKGISKFVTGYPDPHMPAVLQEADIPVWLGDTGASLDEVRACLRPFEDEGAWEMRPEAGRKASRRALPPKRAQGDLF